MSKDKACKKITVQRHTFSVANLQTSDMAKVSKYKTRKSDPAVNLISFIQQGERVFTILHISSGSAIQTRIQTIYLKSHSSVLRIGLMGLL